MQRWLAKVFVISSFVICLSIVGARTTEPERASAQDNAPAAPKETAPAQTGAKPAQTSAKQTPEYMFVQNADGVSFKDGKLTLQGVSPTTIYFTDWPVRSAGNATTKDFLGMWSKGPDSFAKDPPNASLSVFGKDGKVTDMIVELSNPSLHGNDLTYDIRTLQGEPPKHSGAAALFIDWVAVGVGAPAVVLRPRVVVVR